MGTWSVIILLAVLVILLGICPEEGAPHGYTPKEDGDGNY